MRQNILLLPLLLLNISQSSRFKACVSLSQSEGLVQVVASGFLSFVCLSVFALGEMLFSPAQVNVI